MEYEIGADERGKRKRIEISEGRRGCQVAVVVVIAVNNQWILLAFVLLKLLFSVGSTPCSYYEISLSCLFEQMHSLFCMGQQLTGLANRRDHHPLPFSDPFFAPSDLVFTLEKSESDSQ
jgi:hypothetical protein